MLLSIIFQSGLGESCKTKKRVIFYSRLVLPHLKSVHVDEDGAGDAYSGLTPPPPLKESPRG